MSSGSDDTESPCRDHFMDSGSSPCVTVQSICTNCPSFKMSDPSVRGMMTGGSVKIRCVSFHNPKPSSSVSTTLFFQLPLTPRLVEKLATPALFLAVQVYLPPCMLPTESILKKLARDPIGAVVIPRPPPDISLSDPWRLQEILRGISPELTMQEIWAYSPSSKTSFPKENGTI